MNLKELDYPEKCPPSTAKPITGDYYRFCNDKIISPEDFLTHVELKAKFPPSKRCEACALSFFDNPQSALDLKKKFPQKFGNKRLIEFHITEEWGIGEKKRDHLNLWQAKVEDYTSLCQSYKEVPLNG